MSIRDEIQRNQSIVQDYLNLSHEILSGIGNLHHTISERIGVNVHSSDLEKYFAPVDKESLEKISESTMYREILDTNLSLGELGNKLNLVHHEIKVLIEQIRDNF